MHFLRSLRAARSSPLSIRRHRASDSSKATWFCPKQHVWLRPIANPPKTIDEQDSVQIDVGLTQYRLDRMGDITACARRLTSLPETLGLIHEGDPLLDLSWDGFAQTEADELYHTVWENVEGIETLLAPSPGRLVGYHPVDEQHTLDETTPLVTMMCTRQDYQHRILSLVGESEYNNLVERQFAPGAFAEIS